MAKPDALSRREHHTVGIEDDNKGIVVLTPDKIRTTILTVDDGNILKHKIFDTMCLLNETDIQKLCIKNTMCKECNGCLYSTYRRLYIPNSNILWMEIIQKHHNTPVSGHLGYEKTIELLQHNYWWPGMAILVKDYIARSNTCQRFKGSNWAPAGLLQPLPISNTPWEHISANFITDLSLFHGYDSILTIVDHLYEKWHVGAWYSIQHNQGWETRNQNMGIIALFNKHAKSPKKRRCLAGMMG